ncbi:MAG: thioredoxin domain-containing protein [Candidatus Manganitrophus sp. SB1]|nr:thioredoxin domain-containing protein [Candidatus Manganitrophus morganii]
MANKKQKEKARVSKEERKAQRARSRMALWTSVIAGVMAVVIGVVWVAAPPSGEVTGRPDASLTEISQDEWIKGNPNAPVTLVEYSDFQCPSCGTYFPLLKELNSEFDDRLRIVYRHYPLGFHAHAELAAQAAEAAGKQGKFWQMHDLIFRQQKDWSEKVGSARALFIGYARDLGLDMARFEADLDSKEVRQAVDADRRSGDRLGVDSTPTFFLNGVKIQNPRGYDPFKNLIEKAMADAS